MYLQDNMYLGFLNIDVVRWCIYKINMSPGFLNILLWSDDVFTR